MKRLVGQKVLRETFFLFGFSVNDISVHSGRTWIGLAGGKVPGYPYDGWIVFSSFSYYDFSKILCSHWEPGMDE